eukprot:TRINITY_DN99243_c0_g1_i1.p1 TRINITY_DN99243_c0_g1~~TRINITY_DN99243_c0_g1_i1.p1  ORF type:complete len:300 (+),score=57.75 TRINITY_DN99243_c0_g1_i1:75-974(+)
MKSILALFFLAVRTSIAVQPEVDSIPSSFDIKEHKIDGTVASIYTSRYNGSVQINISEIEEQANALVKRKIRKVILADVSADGVPMSMEERRQLVETYTKSLREQRLKVYVHVGGQSLVEAKASARHAASIKGVTGIIAGAPAYFTPSLEQLRAFLKVVARAAPALPLWYHHDPRATGVLSGKAHKILDMTEKASNMPNLMGVVFFDGNRTDYEMCSNVGYPGKYNMLYSDDGHTFFTSEGQSAEAQRAHDLPERQQNQKAEENQSKEDEKLQLKQGITLANEQRREILAKDLAKMLRQ